MKIKSILVAAALAGVAAPAFALSGNRSFGFGEGDFNV